MRVSEQLYAAADLVRQGWIQFGGFTPADDGAVCLEGAILQATGLATLWDEGEDVDANRCPAGEAVRDYLELGENVRLVNDLYKWNDAAGRTATEVEEVLRACAVIEAAREDEARGPKPGDLCRILSETGIAIGMEHVAPCLDGHRTGTVTALDGSVLGRAVSA